MRKLRKQLQARERPRVFCRICDRLPQLYFFMVLEVRCPKLISWGKSRCWQGCLLEKVLHRNCSQAFSDSSGRLCTPGFVTPSPTFHGSIYLFQSHHSFLLPNLPQSLLSDSLCNYIGAIHITQDTLPFLELQSEF